MRKPQLPLPKKRRLLRKTPLRLRRALPRRRHAPRTGADRDRPDVPAVAVPAV